VLFGAAFAMSASPAAETVNGYINPPTDADTLHLYHPLTPSEEEINEHILNHPLSVSLRSQTGMIESRPHMRIPPAMRPHNLTAGVLAGEGKIEVPPLSFNDKEAEMPTMVQIMYFGDSLCGHPGIVHGGLLATMLDEGLARACFPALPNKIGVTASLKIDYRVPCPAGSYVVLKAYTEKVEGRKAWVKGWIELLGEKDGSGTKVVEAEALFIEPKNAKSLAANLVASG
jgi:acyl-coenzyme A thioesterase PaaI-like protein